VASFGPRFGRTIDNILSIDKTTRPSGTPGCANSSARIRLARRWTRKSWCANTTREHQRRRFGAWVQDRPKLIRN
jgi:hypothetical protein